MSRLNLNHPWLTLGGRAWTVQELAKACGYSQASGVSRVFGDGSRRPGVKLLLRVCEVTGADLQEAYEAAEMAAQNRRSNMRRARKLVA